MSGAPPFPAERLVTLANWQGPPSNRWSFWHIRELIPSARIACGGPAWDLRHERHELGTLTFSARGRPWTLAGLLAATYTDGFLVMHRGTVVTEDYRDGIRPDCPHLLMSVSKSVAGAIAGILAGRGQLDLTAPVTELVPELRGTSFDGATPAQLLDMRTGTRFDENYDDPQADVRTYEQVYLWRPRNGQPWDGRPLPADAISYFPMLRNDGPHGGPFRYRSILTDVLAWVLERAAGARLPELIARELWQPMGAEFDAEITVDAHGNPMADGGISATLRDLGRFGQLFLQGGTVRGRHVVPAEWIEDTIRGAPDGAQAFVAGDNPPGYPPGAHYRNCWWVREPDVPFYHASGINGQHVFVHVPAELVVVKLSSWPTPLHREWYEATVAAVQAIADTLS